MTAQPTAVDDGPAREVAHVAVVRNHIELFIVAVVAVSLVPVGAEAWRSRGAARTGA